MTIATSASALPTADLGAVVSQLQAVVQQLSALVQTLQASAPGAAAGGGPGTAAAGVGQLADATQAAPAAAPGGCGCGGASGAVGGVAQVDQGALGAPSAKDAAKASKHSRDSRGSKDSKGSKESKDVQAPTTPPAPQADGPSGAPKTELHPGKDQKQIDDFLQYAGKAYGTSPSLLHQIALKESSFDENAINRVDSNAQNGHPSEGMFQFIPTTFADYAAKAKAADPKSWAGLGNLNFHDWRQQALACSWAIQNGHGGAWATFGAAKAAA